MVELLQKTLETLERCQSMIVSSIQCESSGAKEQDMSVISSSFWSRGPGRLCSSGLLLNYAPNLLVVSSTEEET